MIAYYAIIRHCVSECFLLRSAVSKSLPKFLKKGFLGQFFQILCTCKRINSNNKSLFHSLSYNVLFTMAMMIKKGDEVIQIGTAVHIIVGSQTTVLTHCCAAATSVKCRLKSGFSLVMSKS